MKDSIQKGSSTSAGKDRNDVTMQKTKLDKDFPAKDTVNKSTLNQHRTGGMSNSTYDANKTKTNK